MVTRPRACVGAGILDGEEKLKTQENEVERTRRMEPSKEFRSYAVACLCAMAHGLEVSEIRCFSMRHFPDGLGDALGKGLVRSFHPNQNGT